MRETMRHRGPDHAGLWISPDGRVALGHRRLSIVDLSASANQPFVDNSGRLAITFNGEIYNHTELRAELESVGSAFRTKCDTEVILEGYRVWGEEIVPRLNGMFAFAIHDASRRKLFLARDRAGEKPLFYSMNRGEFRFASELKAIMADPAFEARLDYQSVESYLAYGYVLGEKCILRDVRKLLPGYSLTIDLDSTAGSPKQFWKLPEPSTMETGLDELAHELEHLLRDSVRRQLVADVPVGVLLSGGLDSSLVTAAAAGASSRRVRTFTVRFPGHHQHDEGEFARVVSDHFNTEHVELVAEPASVEVLPLLAEQFDEPMCDSSMIPTYLISQQIRKSATVALGGDGGDELFGGYRSYELLLKQQWIASLLPAAVRRVISRAARHIVPVGMKGRNYLSALDTQLGARIASARRLFDESYRRRLVPDLGSGPSEAETLGAGLCDPTLGLPGAAMAADFRGYLSGDILVKVDRASMLASLEVRSPWLDYRIIDFAFSRVPNRFRIRGSKQKIVSREVARSMLPASLNLDRKQGFSLPLQSWLQGSWGSYVSDVLFDPSSTFFNGKAVRSLFEGQKRGYSNGERIFALVLFELWRRKYRPHLS